MYRLRSKIVFMNIKRIFTTLNLSAAALLFLLTAFPVSGQPNLDQKRSEAKAAAAEAAKLRDRGTFKSYQLAIEKFQIAAKLYEELGEKPFVGYALLGIGMIKNDLNENQEALEYSQKALAIFRAVGPNYLEASALLTIGRLYNKFGDRRRALEHFDQALQIRKSLGNRSEEAIILNSIGLVFNSSGEKHKALEYINRSLAIVEELGDCGAQAYALNNIGQIYTDLGEYKKAVEFLRKSLSMHQAVGDKPGAATTLNNLGLVNLRLGDPTTAISYYNQALGIFSELGLEGQIPVIWSNLGSAYMELGQSGKAIAYARRALPFFRSAKNKNEQITNLNNIAVASLDLGETAEAMKTFNEALVLVRSTEAKGIESGILGNLMRSAINASNSPLAVFYGKQCINLYQEQRLAIKDLDKSVQKAYLSKVGKDYRVLADLLIENGNFVQAKQVLQMLKEEEYFEFVRRDAGEVKTLAQRVVLSDKEKLLIERYSKLAESAAATGAKFELLDDKKRQLAQSGATLAPAEETEYERLSAELADANAAFKLFLEKELVRDIGGENARKIEIDRALQDKLRKFGNGTVAVSTVVTNDRYRVIVTTPNVQIDGKTEIKSSELNKKIFAFREALKDPAIETRILGKDLYDILIKPIESVLKDANAKTIVWSLDGTLRYIPLAALSPDGETYLVEKYQTVILTPQTRDDISDSNVGWKAIGMGVSTEQSVFYPDFPNDPVKLEALPSIESELKTIIRENNTSNEKGILPGKRFLNEGFTLKNLTDSLARKTADGKKEFSVVHLASHFRLAKNWSDSFLLIGNGKILTLEEISNSPLINFADIDLVTLSACNTASSEDSNGGEVDSLAGLIQTKNGKSVLATLWEVEDESTAILMSNFYRLRKENPQITKAEAMQSAQKLLLYGGATPNRAAKPAIAKFPYNKSRPMAHPVYWSPFVLIGNWR